MFGLEALGEPLQRPLVAASAVLAGALVLGLLRARAGVWWLRLLLLMGACALLASAVDPTVATPIRSQPRWRFVANGEVSPALHQRIALALGADAIAKGQPFDIVAASPDAGELAVALHAAKSGDGVPALLWLQPIAGDGAPATSRGDVPVFTAVPALEFEPSSVSVRATGPMRVGRPLALELTGLPTRWRGEVLVSEPGDVELARSALNDAGGAVRARVECLPVQPGEHVVVVEAIEGTRRMVARGAFTVAAPPPVLWLGADAASLAPALRAQGLVVQSEATLPQDLQAFDAVVVARALESADQERLRAYVDGGGGVFFLGAQDGAALPIASEPGAELSPVRLAVRPKVASGNEPGQGQNNEIPPRDPPRDPPPSRDTPPKAPPNDKPPTGDTADTKPPTGPEQEVNRRDVAMVFVIDRSQSMLEQVTPGGPTRMDFVRSSAQATASKLLPGDEVAIVTFGNRDTEEVVLPLTPATDLERVHRAFGQLAARRFEGTYVESAVERAASLLDTSRAAVQHVVVITDGLIEDLIASFAHVQALRARGVSVSMIRFGSTQDSLSATHLCRQFAEFGGGKYVHSTDTAEVPALVSSEVKRVLASTGRKVGDDGQVADAKPTPPTPRPPTPAPPEGADKPPPVEPQSPIEPPTPAPPPRLLVRVVEPSALLAPLPADGPPAVAAILPVSARPEARVLLAAGDDGRPLLAFKNYGLGRVGAWTADLAGPWSTEWRAAPAFPAWLAQWVSSLAPPATATEAIDVLRTREVQPLGPTPAEVAALARFSSAPLRAVDDVRAPAPIDSILRTPRGDWCALVAAGMLLLLAVFEFVAARRTAAAAVDSTTPAQRAIA